MRVRMILLGDEMGLGGGGVGVVMLEWWLVRKGCLGEDMGLEESSMRMQ